MAGPPKLGPSACEHHEWLCSAQIDRIGGGKFGSANAPTATAMSSGLTSGSQNTVDPHTGQKWKASPLPLSAVLVKVFHWPFGTPTLARAKKAVTPKVEPVRR